MVAVDTNVVVRLLTADDDTQTEIARQLFARERIYLARSVLLETVWVLGGAYGLDRDAVVAVLAGLAGLDNVVLEQREQILDALELARSGVDLPDAMHLTATPTNATFATFDRSFVRAASGTQTAVGVTNLLQPDD